MMKTFDLQSYFEKIKIKPVKLSDLDKLNSNVPNEFGITSKDMIGDLNGFPIGIIVRIMEEQKKQGNKPDIKVFQEDRFAGEVIGGFDWGKTKNGMNFWGIVLGERKFDFFYNHYPEYKKYDDSITEKIQINPISVSDLDELSSNIPNKFGITSKDMIGDIKKFPVGVVVRMMEEQEKQRNNPDITVFQERKERDIDRGGFHWKTTEDGQVFWEIVIMDRKFDEFYKKYPEYKKYDDHDINEKLNIPEISLSQLDKMDNTPSNPFGITKKDLVGAIQEYPMAIIIKALEEEKRQRGDHISNKALLDILYEYGFGGAFDWSSSKEGYNFWARISRNKNFDEFYKKYPEYKKYDC